MDRKDDQRRHNCSGDGFRCGGFQTTLVKLIFYVIFIEEIEERDKIRSNNGWVVYNFHTKYPTKIMAREKKLLVIGEREREREREREVAISSQGKVKLYQFCPF
jgi:hypothetical protein